jgi:hypothetical protein
MTLEVELIDLFKTKKQKMKSLLATTTFVLCIAFAAIAQSPKVKGDLGFLKGASAVKVEFDYSDMSVGKFDNEDDYVTKRRNELNEKEAERGDSWAMSWVSDREGRYEPKYMELLSEVTAKSGKTFSKDGEGEYIMVVHTTKTDPGFNIGITKKPSYINTKVEFFAPDNRDKALATMTLENVQGVSVGGGDFDTGNRIAESYAKSGKIIGKYLVKKAF